MKKLPGHIWIPVLLAAFCIVLLWGAAEQVQRGNGFLWIPSSTWTSSPTPTASMTQTASPTPTASMTQTASPTPTASMTWTVSPMPTVSMTWTPSPFPTSTATLVPASPSPTVTAYPTYTPLPTIDKTAFAAAVFADLTSTALSYALSQTPAPTAVIADADLTTGLLKENPKDGKELIYIQKSDSQRWGFWMNIFPVTAEEYNVCAAAGACDPIKQEISGGIPGQYSQEVPAVYVTRTQASAYCKWAEMNLLSSEDWYIALSTFPAAEGEPDLHLTGFLWEWTADTDGLILGGSRKSGSWDLSHQRYEAQMDPESAAEDVGFRCAADVPRS